MAAFGVVCRKRALIKIENELTFAREVGTRMVRMMIL